MILFCRVSLHEKFDAQVASLRSDFYEYGVSVKQGFTILRTFLQDAYFVDQCPGA